MKVSTSTPLRFAEKLHANERIWQILIPILICILAAIGIGAMVVFASFNHPGLNEKWAQISLVFLIVPLLFLGVILGIVIAATSRLITKAHRVLPPQFSKLDHLVHSVRRFAEMSANKITNPVIAIGSTKAGVTRLFELAFHLRANPKDRK